MLVAALVTVSAAAAIADHGKSGNDNWSGTEYDDQYNYEWCDPNDGTWYDDTATDQPDNYEESANTNDSADGPQAESEILDRFDQLTPAEWRDRIVSFELESDGRDGLLAAVEPLRDDLTEWALIVDPADADYELDATLIHEFAHVLTLNEIQIDAQLVYLDREYERAAAACKTHFTGEGCALPESYISQFVDLVWDPIMNEFESINEIESDR